MERAIHDLLLSCDVADAWENPPDADWPRSMGEIRALKPALEAVLGIELALDDGVQDASFFAELGLLVKQDNPGGAYALWYEVAFRFSSYGKLYTVHGDSWESRVDERAHAVLRDAGFRYVPRAPLDEPYDGVNKSSPQYDELSWWTRYFDYL